MSKAVDSPWYLQIHMALFCGLRKGEIYGLKFSDFDMEHGIVTVSRQVTSNPVMSDDGTEYQVIEKFPKIENSNRRLRVPEAVMREIRKRRMQIEESKEKLGEDYIDSVYVSGRKDDLSHSMFALSNARTKLCSRNGLMLLPCMASGTCMLRFWQNRECLW